MKAQLLLLSVFFYTIMIHSAQKPCWLTSTLYGTTIHLGMLSDDNIIDISLKADMLALGKNGQQILRKEYFDFSVGSLERISPGKKIYLNANKSISYLKRPIVMQVTEPRITKEDVYKKDSFFYMVRRINIKISEEPTMFEFHEQYAQLEAQKDLSKCYKEIFSLDLKTKKKEVIAFIPLIMGASLKKTAQIAVLATRDFINMHREKYAAIYILAHTGEEYDAYAKSIKKNMLEIIPDENVS